MKIQIRTKDDLVKLLSEGVSAAWRVNKGRLNSITEVEIYNFSGNARIVGAFDRDNTKVLDSGRVAVAFTNAKIEPCEFKWVGQNPIKYKSGNDEEVELMEDEVDVNDQIHQESSTLSGDSNPYSLASIDRFSEEYDEFINFIRNLEFNPRENAELIIKANPEARDLIEVLEIYLQALLDKFDGDEDTFRDICYPLTRPYSHFEEFHAPAYHYDCGEEFITDPDDDDYQTIPFDVLKAFFKLSSDESNIPEGKQKEFAYAILECWIKDEEDDLYIPDDLMDNFDDYMIDKLEYVADRIGME